MPVKYSPCTRARHGVGHDIGQPWRFESVSCPFSSARPFYRISIPAAGGLFTGLLGATCARLGARRPGHRRNSACPPSAAPAPMAPGRVSRCTSAQLRRRGVGCRRYARLRSATLHCALLRAGSQHRKGHFNGNGKVNYKEKHPGTGPLPPSTCDTAIRDQVNVENRSPRVSKKHFAIPGRQPGVAIFRRILTTVHMVKASAAR